MIIGQIGDLHLEEKRLEEQVRCIEYAIDAGNKAGVQVWLVLGDIWGTKVPYHATELERLTFGRFLKRMGEDRTVVVVRGNHDADGALDLYELLSEQHDMETGGGVDVHVVNAPRVFHDLAQYNLSVIAFPYPSKRWVVGAEGAKGIETLRVDLSERLFEILRGLLLSVETKECIIVGHCNIGGSRTGGGEILAGQEIELSKAQLGELFEIQPRLRYIGLGHIHQAQEIIPGAWYAGTPSSQGFDRCNEHGFLLIDTERREDDGAVEVQFIPTPATRHYTADVEWRQDETGWHWGPMTWTPPEPNLEENTRRGAMVKLRPRIPETQRKAADYTRLVDELRLDGATVIVDPCVIPHARRRDVALTIPTPADVAARGKESLRDGLAQLWQSQNPPPAKDVQARA